jgi:rRNA maturation endonuclease Nob1
MSKHKQRSDAVTCMNCEKSMLVPRTAGFCPLCGHETLAWNSTNGQWDESCTVTVVKVE